MHLHVSRMFNNIHAYRYGNLRCIFVHVFMRLNIFNTGLQRVSSFQHFYSRKKVRKKKT